MAFEGNKCQKRVFEKKLIWNAGVVIYLKYKHTQKKNYLQHDNKLWDQLPIGTIFLK